MKARSLQRWLCHLSLRIASAGMREWAAAMVREVEEIDDPRAALEWAAACLLTCIGERLRPFLRVAAIAARLSLAVCCLAVAWRMSEGIAVRLLDGASLTGRMSVWLFGAALFVLTAALVAFRRAAAAWTALTATAIIAVNFLVALNAALEDLRVEFLSPEQLAMFSQERMAGYALIAAMSATTVAAFWLTRRPAHHFVI